MSRTVSQKDLWVRDRWATWLGSQLASGVSHYALDQQLRRASGGHADIRHAIRAWCDKARTVSADAAFRVGEALRELTPGPVNGLVAVAAAGHFLEFARCMHALSSQPDTEGSEDFVSMHFLHSFMLDYLVVAESDLFFARGHKVTDEVEKWVYQVRAGWTQSSLNRPGKYVDRTIKRSREMVDVQSHLSPEDVQKITSAWSDQRGDKDLLDPKKSQYDAIKEAAALLGLLQNIPSLSSTHPEAAWRAARAILWQWATLTDPEGFFTGKQREIDVVEGLIDWQSYKKWESEHPEGVARISAMYADE